MNTAAPTNRGIRIILSIVTILLALPLAFWGYRLLSYKQVNGKVLIVQRNADVKKLALIQIGAVDADDIARWKQSLNEKLRQEVETIHLFQQKAAADEAEIIDVGTKRVANAIECKNRTDEAIETVRKIWLVDRNSGNLRQKISDLLSRGNIPRNHAVSELIKSNDWQEAYRLLSTTSLTEAIHMHELAEDDRKKTLEAHQKGYRKALVSMRDGLDYLIPPLSVKSLPKDIKVRAHDITDETGSFTLKVPPGEYYIFAEGERTVFSAIEHYFWAHPISVPSQESDKCLMGNLNLNGESTINDDLWYELRRTIAEQKSTIQP
jgi:hypothetical protein